MLGPISPEIFYLEFSRGLAVTEGVEFPVFIFDGACDMPHTGPPSSPPFAPCDKRKEGQEGEKIPLHRDVDVRATQKWPEIFFGTPALRAVRRRYNRRGRVAEGGGRGGRASCRSNGNKEDFR